MHRSFFKGRILLGFLMAMAISTNILISAFLDISGDCGAYHIDGITISNVESTVVPKEHFLRLLSIQEIVSCPRFNYLKLIPLDEIELTPKDILILTHYHGATPSPELDIIRTFDPITVEYSWQTMSISISS